MAFVPNYESDIFISCAPADDERDAPGDREWVTGLVSGLDTLLAQKLGRAGWAKLFFDSERDASQTILPETASAVSNSAMLLIILSEAYLESQACQRELEVFHKSIDGNDEAARRVSVVLRSDIDRERWPERLRHLLGHEFFQKTDSHDEARAVGVYQPEMRDKLYATRLDDLSTELAGRLKHVKAQAESSSPVTENVVFLAEATDDLSELRDSVKRYLLQGGLRIVPDYWYPRTPDGFREATLKDLSQCNLFVQLLGTHSFPKFDGLSQGYGGLQAELAEQVDKPILRWRSPELDPNAVADRDHRAMLESEHVIAVGLEEFKRMVVQRANAFASRVTSSVEGTSVLINANDVDLPLASKVGEALIRNGLVCDITNRTELSFESVGDNQACLGGLLIVYGQCPAIWVRQQLWRYRKAMARSESQPPVCAVYEGPPQSKDPLRFTLPTLEVIDGRASLDESALHTFITAVQGRCSP